MNDPEPRPTDEQFAALLASADKDAPPPDRAFLDQLRERSLAAFKSAPAPSGPAAPAPLNPPRKRTMLPTPFRWLAASAALVAILGAVIAYWVGATRAPVPEPAPEEKFVVEPSLVDDGRIGKVTDAQGAVSVQPVMHERWSPVQPRLALKPGDRLRTDARGANAVALKLVKSAAVVVGPHSTVELVKADELRVLEGEIEIDAEKPVELHGPDQQTLSVKGKQIYRVEKEKLIRVEKEPQWLRGFRGTTANESLGSLVATVDGRAVPLTVGYHHVTVDVRDQIARTTIEESFVNTTNGVLEGVFHFPLPQDASISGFGMWIGDQLVEADVVEKQRAREIYETILQERRDPGLLEWTGGNVFKARVYPIFARSEKRIKITYTQVLPLQGNRYRYSYGLQSELLKQHPVRDLKIDLEVNSAVPLKSVSSPTHAARVAKTEHSGHVEWSAQEHTPTRDFEAVFEIDGARPDVVVIPHRHGDDGYFLVQLTPPGTAADRPIVPDGEPLRLLLLADTSASMDKGQRTAQASVLTSLLGSLTTKDTINVAACDVNCDWVFEKPVPATPANVAAVQDFLAKRASLGWTDLDKAFASAMATSAAGTHVVYLGDGIGTTGNADPVAFAKRLRQTYEGKAGTFHAVALGSSYEPSALKAIASLGGGSMRRVSGDRGPPATALDLLTEIAAPGLRDVKVEFVGFRTARVYPETLPNVPAGTQQILLGRYLPEGKDQSGEIVVTGTLGGKSVRFASKVALKDAESGNSFVPRLWARTHLDALLEQGRSEEVKRDVIALSEEFNIITPYTSLLVLESDADRERFAVKRRFQMRDGERFFADGRDNANFELKQKQMRLAGDYRTALRRAVLHRLNALGRDTSHFSPRDPYIPYFASYDFAGLGLRLSEDETDYKMHGGLGGAGDVLGRPVVEDSLVFAPREFEDGFVLVSGSRDKLGRRDLLAAARGEEWFDDGIQNSPAGWGYDKAPLVRNETQLFNFARSDFDVDGTDVDGPGYSFGERPTSYVKDLKLKAPAAQPFFANPFYRGRHSRWPGSLFPTIAEPAREPKRPKSIWPADALALSRGLLRTDKLAGLKGGVVVDRRADGFSRGELSGRVRRLELVTPTAWFERTAPDGGPVTLAWCDAKEYGAYDTAFQLGRVRPSNAHDLRQFPLELSDHSLTPLHESRADLVPTVEPAGKDRALLVLKYPLDPDHEIRVLIDTARHVVLSTEYRNKGTVTGTTKFDDFVEVAGTWWARRVETLDDRNRRQSLTTQTVTELPADEFAKRMAAELAGRNKVLFLRQPLPSVAAAKKAVADGEAGFDDRAVLTLHFAATQQWERAFEHLRECEKLSAGKTGRRWLRDAFLLASRRHDELRKRLLDEAAALAATTDADARANDHFLAEHLLGQAARVLQTNEALELSDALRKVYERQPAHLNAAKAWRSRRVALYESAGQPDKARQLRKELATDNPRDSQLQHDYAQALARGGDYPAAYAWLDRALGPSANWDPSEEESLRALRAQFLEQQGRYSDLADFTAAWAERNPESYEAHAQHLSALVYSNRAARAEELVAQWLREAMIEGELTRAAAARFDAARAFALGRGHQLHSNRVAERWHALLAEVALHLARRDTGVARADAILTSDRFASTDAGRAARKTLAGVLVKEIDTLSATRLEHFVSWAGSDAGMERDDWNAVATGLRKRWDAEARPETKHRLGQSLVRVLPRLGTEEVLAFLRVRVKGAPDRYRATYANELFNALLARPWSVDTEDEAFALLDKLADPEAANALFVRVTTLHRLTDAALESRFLVRTGAIERPEKLTRTELLKKHDEARKLSRESFSDRLRQEAARHTGPFAGWLTAERVWLDVQLDRDLKSAAEDCWTILAKPPAKDAPEGGEVTAEERLDELLRARALAVLQNLAARKGADPALVDRLLKYVDQQLKNRPDDARWRSEKYRLLVALDRAKDLEIELGKWVAGADANGRWRLALGYLLAEQGKVAEAIKQFEAIEAADELAPAAYRSLAEWYLVENRRAQHDKARAAVHKTTGEYQLYQLTNRHLYAWQNTRGRLPTRLDQEVLDVFAALFEKSATPQAYLSRLQEFYQASRDFRLLSMLPDAAVGHTAGKAYPFIQGMRSVLGDVRDEATADELVKRIAELRPTVKTPVDQRALDLLELMVERRAADLQNQAGPHADRALAALERAFKREWAPGEPRLMADLLASLGSVPQPTIAKEQLRQLDALHRAAAAGSFDRLHIAQRQAEALSGYSRQAEAADALQAALKEFEGANGGMLPTSANGALGLLISLAEGAGHYDRGEKLLLTQLGHPVHAEQRDWLTRRLYELYRRALEHKGAVSLGGGATLYKALEKKWLADVARADQGQRYHLLTLLTRSYRTAHTLGLAGVADDLKTYAFKLLPPILREQVTNYDAIVRDAADALNQVAGPRDGIAFLLDRTEDEPDRLRYTGEGVWQRYAGRLGEWREFVKDLGDLEPRLLKFVLAELRRDLTSRASHDRKIYDRRYGRYWAEKEADFAKVAGEVLAERKASGVAAEHVAEYLFYGLGHEKRAIEILFAAHEQKALGDAGRAQLINYLHNTRRYAESIPLLLPLVEARPEELGHRTRLMYAYFRTAKRAELLALLKQTDAFFHEKDRWTEGALAALAESCLETELFAQAAAYYEELVPRYQRANPRRAGDGTLSGYYARAARAYAGLGDTKRAVDMASSAVVSWGPNLEQRKHALATLVRVLAGARDLDAYVAELDKEKLQSAVVRKAIGQAYAEKDAPAKALPQLQLASELQPNDPEVYAALLASYDKLGDKEAAVRELLRAVELSRRDVELFERLGQRLTDLNRPAEAERAFTSIVEMLPNESEGHALLAAVRERQKRWPEAIAHWERVAEIRALEPTGLVKLAAAQIGAGDSESAAKNLRKVLSQAWPPRFNDVLREARELDRKLADRPKR